MNEIEFLTLIQQPESDYLDYKAAVYDLKSSRNEFIKDVLAMANTPRLGSAFLVFGVRWSPESGSEVVGLEKQVDDVDFQNAFSTDRAQPLPRFVYKPLQISGKQVGVLEIPRCDNGPYTPVKDYDQYLQAGAVYFRRGTENDRALGGEIKRIVSWFQEGSMDLSDHELWSNEWAAFLVATSSFNPSTTYLLAIDRIDRATPAPLTALGDVSWRAVIDFDTESEDAGALSLLQGAMSQTRVIHRVVKGTYRVQPEPGTHWFFARGLAGRQDTLAATDYKAWLKAYKGELGHQFRAIAAAINPSPCVAVVLWSDVRLKSHLRSLLEELFGTFGEAIEVVVVSSDEKAFLSIAEEYGAHFVKMSLGSLLKGLSVHLADSVDQLDGRYVVPGAGGGPCEIQRRDWLWLSEDLDIAHRGVGIGEPEQEGSFRKGGEISWRELNLHHDCARDITASVRRQVEDDLRKRQTVRINLYHAPGAGGTTVGRRIAWDLHSTVPVAVLKNCSPRETSDRIAQLASLTSNSVLLVVDSRQHSERQIDDLYEILRANQTPVVILQVLRRFAASGRKNKHWVSAELTVPEAARFREVYGQVAPSKQALLTSLACASGPQRTAFFFALTAFESEFAGVKPYVAARLASLTQVQKRIAAFIAMAHYYGQQGLPAQAFAGLLGVPRTKNVDLATALAGDSVHVLELLIAAGRDYRTSHPLVAEAIMRQVFCPGAEEAGSSQWRQHLSSWSKDFALLCKGDDGPISEQLLELVRRIFVYRDNVEVLGTERSAGGNFAQLIEEIPSSNGKADVLQFLTQCFPLEAHFHAHLARLLGASGDFPRALEAIDFAISLNPTDPLLHHMRGVILRRKLAAQPPDVESQLLVSIADEASKSFEESRMFAPDSEHGYIGELQMLLTFVDKIQPLRKAGESKTLSRQPHDPHIRAAMEKMEDLLDRVQQIYAGESPSRYVVDCRARLEGLYGDYSVALQQFDSLLARPDVAKGPIRRQIVWTILRRHNGEWGQLSKKEVRRVCSLLEENLDEAISDSTSLRLWLRSVRFSESLPSLDSVIERVAYWKANTGALDAAYYLFVLQMVQGLAGSGQAAADSERSLETSRELSRYRRDRLRSFEWLGNGESVNALVHQTRLGTWNGEFWDKTDDLRRLEGRISSIEGPQKGQIELPNGMSAFFVPGKAGVVAGRDENARVTFFLGFSYEGPRAWSVELLS